MEPSNGHGHTLRTVLTWIGAMLTIITLTNCAFAITNAQKINAIDARLKTIESRDESNRTMDRLSPQRYQPPHDSRFPTESGWH